MLPENGSDPGRQAAPAEGFDGPLIMIGQESERPYERPPLSKEYLLGKAERDTIYVHPPQWYAEHDVDLRLGVTVTGLYPGSHEDALRDPDIPLESLTGP